MSRITQKSGFISNSESLSSEIEASRKEVKTDSFFMSIGEVINLYKDGDIKLNPAYQRLFRWNDLHKSSFIESILIGIPLPPIFVAQDHTGKWDIVDGLQRLSTILQLTGDLQDERHPKPLVLTETEKLPSLNGLTWETLPVDVQRIIKRTKLGISIILLGADSIQSQYELFRRLNTGGVHLEPQEIRNCLIIMKDKEFYAELDKLKLYKPFENTLGLKDSKNEIEHPMELILRYFIAKHNTVKFNRYNTSTDLLSTFIDTETENLINDKKNGRFSLNNEIKIFKRTFDYLCKAMGKNVFKKFNFDKDKFEGGFLTASYEAIVSGVAHNIGNIEKISHEKFKLHVKNMYKNPNFEKYAKRGVKALSRVQGMIKFSEDYFGNEINQI